MSKYTKIIKYIFAGGFATISNLIILFICVQYFHLWYLFGVIISFSFAVIISYTLQKFFVFNDYSKENIHKQFLKFLIFNIFMLGINTTLMYTFVDTIGLWYLLAQALSSAICAFINYIFFNKVVFK
ncbi:MAG: Cell wall teichoic acid glycosylation protein gtcA [Candidatus Nomurabacteria bacterium GW2011_GWE1_32_28]|uniref:Cell wall teichoic acid glycosylation protein gtcA n=1 Tax=Candidatus Nomurabacteria bacterium GW2011_GWF1_31_48 TaxID=1618767 RepID=A0A0G0ATE6_9BACT|nr:MAG: Cell wall teichoic acid glycosylation protein gtcA [Candidatus Nomurabacteria bacterium GW2011_GWF2_30_133]KKP28385.1 MAG: Cell wall teichoic acid glycosylation protein gtcA [Candidatus Nomurabacteria bacterium GW2011_GWE2_31_40]KKP29970.1 MAG: Cell wall teichoic acid glycosylation protein gtcA [Candidatus Nomurabacteria bacterium GW2011_GWF1_31_48]KKP35103.1 MAG: Cell wall teichoic acid glycosylation protein gtcA [Candidatus Nomurabacteria bacterium GW2011_GWE1_32_28]HAS80915.1 hypothe